MNATDQGPSRAPKRSRATSTVSQRNAREVVSQSHRKTVHVIAISDCGGTALLLMALIFAFITSTVNLFTDPQDPRVAKKEINFFDYSAIGMKVIAVTAVSFNICICVQLMHHTKPNNEKCDVLKRAESWKSYNVFLVVLLPFQVIITVFTEDYASASLALVFILFRIGFLVVVQRYIRELKTDLARIRPDIEPSYENSRYEVGTTGSDENNVN